MKSFKLIALLCLVLCCAVLFGACSEKPKAAPAATAAPTEVPTETITTEKTVSEASSGKAEATPIPTPEASPEPTEEPTPEPTKEPTIVRDRNPLTGEKTEKDYHKLRPVAVMIENSHLDGQMITQGGLSQASIIYEYEVEKITRTMAIFMDISEVGQIVPIRSARPHFARTALAYDAIFAHCGSSNTGVDKTDRFLEQNFTDNDNIDIGFTNNTGYRLEYGIHTGEHGMATTGELLTKYFETVGTRTEHETDYFDYRLRFTEDAAPTDGETASSVHVVFPEGKTSDFTYHPELNGYTCDQWFTDWKDENTGEPLVFQNLLILYAPTEIGADASWHSVIQNTKYEGDGIFYNGGYAEHITWKRGGNDTPFRYYNSEGKTLKLGIGKTYIGFVSTETGGATHS